MKRWFPGDPEFSRDSYRQLPYEYVLSAYQRRWDSKRQELYEHELPIAYLNATIANTNRNPKTRKTPFTPTDFVIYGDPKEQNLPAAAGAAAYISLAKKHLLPSWALFCFTDMKSRGQGPPPVLEAFICDDAILLAPEAHADVYMGLLIARESASEKKRKMTSPTGREVWLQLPKIETKFIAMDDQELKVV